MRFLKTATLIMILFLFASILVILSFTQAEEGASVTILSSSGHLDSVNAYYVYGELQNFGNTPLWLNITTTYYDSSNNVVNSTFTVCGWNPILPNDKVPFWTILWDSDENKRQGPQVDHYTIDIDATEVKDVVRPQLTILSENRVTAAYSIEITGEIENSGTVNANYTYLHVTYYDANGKVVYVDHYSSPESNHLAPGEKSSFKALMTESDLIQRVASYSITPQAEPISWSFIGTTPEQPPSQGGTPPNNTVPTTIETNVVWEPPHQSAVVATAVTASAVGVAAAVTAGASSPSSTIGKVFERLLNLLPEGAKKWLEEYLSSKGKGTVKQKNGSFLVPTKMEAVAYAVAVVALTIGFSYVKVTSLDQILLVLPTILATAVIIEVVKTYTLEVVARRLGILAEHKIWYFGLVMFLITTFGFGLPFSSPSRNEYECPQLTKRRNAIVASASIIIALGFAAIFSALLVGGFTLIGSTGLAMCIILGFIDSFPVAPLSGKAIYQYKKAAWAGFFVLTLAIYVSWLIFF